MWLLENDTRQALERAYAAGLAPTAEQQDQFMARYGREDGENEARLLTIFGDSASVNISGIITKAPDFLAMLFGGGNVTYRDINRALAVADADPTVKNITLAIDSPGGQFDGLFDTLAAIQATKKPVRAVVNGMAASAAYAIAAQAETIHATNKAARIGSVGVVGTFRVREDEVTITSTNAPRKRPDVTTDAGRAMVREELDALHAIFVDAIATGRGKSVDTINTSFGQGATLLAEEAKSRGMIDSVATLRVVKAPTTTASSGQKEVKIMDLKTLQASHPDVYAAAVAVGEAQERDRVGAHLMMGEKSGALDVALAAVRDGSAMTHTLQATYLTAGMNRNDQSNRASDDATAAAATAAAATTTTDETEADKVAAMVAAQFGVADNA